MYPFCIGLPGWIYCMIIPLSFAHSSMSFEVNSGPLSVRIHWGLPRSSMILSSTHMALLEERDVPTSMASASLEPSSMRFSVRNFLPPTILSLIKSIDQTLFKAVCCCNGWAGSLRLPFLFLFSFSSLYTLCTPSFDSTFYLIYGCTQIACENHR
jgi:hypothetical protein